MKFGSFVQQISNRLSSLFSKKQPERKPQIFEVNTPAPRAEAESMRATKAYADERQKSRHNRRRKPSKAMRNLYCLG